MSQSLGNLAEVEVNDFSPFPAGIYTLHACEVGDLKQNKSETGAYVPVTFEVVEGEQKSRRIFKNFSYFHDNPKTVQISLQQTKAWIIACGLDGNIDLTVDVLKSLEGREFSAEVVIKPDSSGVPKNEIRAFLAPDDDGGLTAAVEQKAPTPKVGGVVGAVPAAKGKKPWEK